MSEVIEWEVPDNVREPFQFSISSKPNGQGRVEEFELAALDDPGAPLELMQLALIVMAEADEEEQGSKALVGFIEYFKVHHTRLYRCLDRHPASGPVLLNVIKRWAEHSELDPKALRS